MDMIKPEITITIREDGEINLTNQNLFSLLQSAGVIPGHVQLGNISIECFYPPSSTYFETDFSEENPLIIRWSCSKWSGNDESHES